MTKVIVAGPASTVFVESPHGSVLVEGGGGPVFVGTRSDLDALRWRGVLLDPASFGAPLDGYVPRFDADLDRWVADSPGSLSTVIWDNVTDKPSTFPPSAHTHPWSDLSSFVGSSLAQLATRNYSDLQGIPATFAPSAHVHAAGDITSGTFADARIAASNVTQHQAALAIAWGQLTGVPSTFTPAAHTHPWSDIDDFTGSDLADLETRDYSDLQNIPATFAPAAHTHPLADLTGFGADGGYIRSNGAAWVRVAGLAWADVSGAPAFALDADLDAHVADTANPHAVTKAQVGLGNVENTALSTWAGSTNITTLGTIATGVWNATAIAWAKVDKTGSSLADLATRSASDLTSGNLPYAQLPTGSGNWDTGAGTAITITQSLTVAGQVLIGTNDTFRTNEALYINSANASTIRRDNASVNTTLLGLMNGNTTNGNAVNIDALFITSDTAALKGAGSLRYVITDHTATGATAYFAIVTRQANVNAERLRVSGAGIGMAAAQKFYFDGVTLAGDTFLTESSANVLDASVGGTVFRWTTTALGLSVNDSAALGTATLSWSDLFLASGAVINYANGDYTVTHSAGLLTTSGKLKVGGNFAANGATPAAAPDYTVTNPTTNRALDVTGATLAQGMQVLGTVISDLIAMGLYQ